jgi:hypothetical protein
MIILYVLIRYSITLLIGICVMLFIVYCLAISDYLVI